MELRYKHDRAGDTSALRVQIVVSGPTGAVNGLTGIGGASGLPEGVIDAQGWLKAVGGTSPYNLPVARAGSDPEPPLHTLRVLKGSLPIASVTFRPVAEDGATFIDVNALHGVGKPVAVTPEFAQDLNILKDEVEQTAQEARAFLGRAGGVQATVVTPDSVTLVRTDGGTFTAQTDVVNGVALEYVNLNQQGIGAQKLALHSTVRDAVVEARGAAQQVDMRLGELADLESDIAQSRNEALAAAGINPAYISETTADPPAAPNGTKGAKRSLLGDWQRLERVNGVWVERGSPLVGLDGLSGRAGLNALDMPGATDTARLTTLLQRAASTSKKAVIPVKSDGSRWVVDRVAVAGLAGQTLEIESDAVIESALSNLSADKHVLLLSGFDRVVLRGGLVRYTGAFDTGSSYSGTHDLIRIENCLDVKLFGPRAEGGNKAGIYVKACRNVSIIAGRGTRNRTAGLWLDSTEYSEVIGGEYDHNGLMSDFATGYGIAHQAGAGTIAKKSIVLGTHCHHNARKGIDHHAPQDLIISNNICDHNQVQGIYALASDAGTQAARIVVTDNIVTNVVVTDEAGVTGPDAAAYAATFHYGIYVGAAAGASIDHARVTGNTVANVNKIGVQVATAGIRTVDVSHNTVDGVLDPQWSGQGAPANGLGIVTDNLGNPESIKAVHNTVRGFGQAGMYILKGQDVDLSNNTLTGDGSYSYKGFYLGDSAALPNLTMRDNDVGGVTNFPYARLSQNWVYYDRAGVLFDGNRLGGVLLPTLRGGRKEWLASDTSQANLSGDWQPGDVIHKLSTSHADIAGWTCRAAPLTFAVMPKMIGSAIVSFAAVTINAGGKAELTGSVPGAVVGKDAASVSASGFPGDDITVLVGVSAADTVKVRVVNRTAAAITLTRDFVVTVTRIAP